jgi:hypothetical protein
MVNLDRFPQPPDPDSGNTSLDPLEDLDREWYDLTLELQAEHEAEQAADRERDQLDLDAQQHLDGEDRCLMLD